MNRLLPAGRPLRRVLRRRRRPLAALCAAAATWAALHALAPPPARTVPVVVAARDLAAGTLLSPDDLTRADLPAAVVPLGVTVPAPGAALAGAMRRGEPFTDVRLVAPGSSRREPGTVVVTVRTADPAAVLSVRPGDRVDVLAGPGTDGLAGPADAPTGPAAQTLGSGLLVLAVPGRPDLPAQRSDADPATGKADGAGGGGLLGATGDGAAGTPVDTAGVLVVAADRTTAARIAASVGRSLSVAVVSP